VDLAEPIQTPPKTPAPGRVPRRIGVAQKPVNPVLSVLFILVFPALVFAGLVALSTRDEKRRNRLRT